MGMDSYGLLVFFHVLLFAYWLGPDWGVFVNGRRVADESLSTEERLRFLVASVAIDVLPRSSIVLIIAVGFSLAYQGGLVDMSGWWLVVVWAVATVWLSLVWLTGYVLQPGALKSRLDAWHMWLRHGLTGFFALLGAYSLATGTPFANAWLATKLILLAVLLAGGSALRVIVGGWVRELTGDTTAKGRIAASYLGTRRLVFLFWGTTIAIAFLGVTKPF